jgi:ABC-type phosphate transport system substrate-binding protein
MKKSVFQIALFVGLQLSLTASAQTEKISLRIPNFARPLVEKWANDYKKNNHNIDFQFTTGKSQDNNTLTLTTDADGISFARYAVLPVTTKDSEAAHLTASHRLNSKKLRSLFFVKDEWDDDTKDSKADQQVHVYTGNSTLSASRLYASHLKQESANYKGKKISGDDSFLTTAINRDPLGITVNYLSNIYDLNSRELRPTLALLPLELDKQGRQTFENGRLDNIIDLLEQEQFAEIPIGNIAFEYNHANTAVNDFVRWILTIGVQDLHQYGLLSLPQKELVAQQHRVDQKFLAQK